ncbi:Vegetative cell wall protein gp1 precursor (Hydroxyproline-rich glycoprotein 1) [Alloactinosynnema sp. L-07]|nr:Vegetative cell wall protein gp1 precursor (Hydroxyproline-rich glycoprotein 1) [Alloactinosynnema sp. L-07]
MENRGHDWVLLPPLAPTVALAAPLVMGPAPVQPPLPGRVPVRRVRIEPAVGRVEGLALALPIRRTDGPPLTVRPRKRPPAEPVEVEETPAPIPRPVVVAPVRDRPTLTVATDEFVGEPRVPAEPYRAPAWMRYVPTWLEQTGPEPIPDAPLAIPSNIPANPPIFKPEPILPPREAEVPLVPRKRPSLGQTRRLGLGAPISYSAQEPAVEPPPEPPPPAPPPPPPPPNPVTAAPLVHHAELPQVASRIVREQVPPDLAGAVRQERGADVSDVPVFRGPAVDAEARSRGARAFAKDGAVYLPDSAGPITSGKTKALLAHELVHVVQQRTIGANLPGLSTPEGRRLEAEAVAAEHRHAGLPDTPLIHPPHPTGGAAPSLAGAAQLALTHTTPPDPTRSHFDQEAREEIQQVAESSAHRVLEEWHAPSAQADRERRSGTTTPPTAGGSFGDTVSFTERRGADATAPTRSTSRTGPGRAAARTVGTTDRAARRQELEAEWLENLNMERASQGEPLLSYLEDADLERIERVIDQEEAGGGGRTSGSSARPINPEEGGAFGDTVSFTTRSGDDLLSRTGAGAGRGGAGASPTAAAGRLSLAAALAQSGGSPAAGSGGSSSQSDQLDPDAGTSFGDTVSFTERSGDDLYRGGRRPDSASSTGGSGSTRDMHGSEEEPIDLDRVDIEDLAARLYDRVRSRLRLELLVDRERSGLLTDFR